MNFIDIILKQKKGIALSEEEIKYVVESYTNGETPDYQMSAFLMAVCFTGMSEEVSALLTKYMALSGEILDMSGVTGVVADKHSTGGVGDKTSLIVGPIVAACGGKIAKMSGRGLGHTGGTIDKLESIDGFCTELPFDKFIEIVNEVGVAIVGQMGNLTPADKKIYALRDVTGTVNSIPLIASSIMSKKLSSGAKIIVLDVKYGSGAFMKTKEEAQKLAKLMVDIGEKNNRTVKALVTSMEEPLGRNIGNSLEVIEALETLKGRGPKDLVDVCCQLAVTILKLKFIEWSEDECYAKVLESIENGFALEKFREMVSRQGGDKRYLDDYKMFKQPKYSYEVKSKSDGVIKSMDTESIGKVACILGAGRKKLGDGIDPSAGITVMKKCGDVVKNGDTLAILYSDKNEVLESSAEEYRGCITVKN